MEAAIRQVCETPAFKAFLQQYNLWLKRCPKCGHLNRGKMPAGEPKGGVRSTDPGEDRPAERAIPNDAARGCEFEPRAFRSADLAGVGAPGNACDRGFHLWHQFEQDEIDRNELILQMKPIQAEIQRRLKTLRDDPGTTKKARGTAIDLLRQWDSLWTYVHRDGAVPTNSEAERSIRKAVLWRKVCLGVGSEAGARFVERMLTLAATARKRGIGLLDWLTRTVQAKLEGCSAPEFRN